MLSFIKKFSGLILIAFGSVYILLYFAMYFNYGNNHVAVFFIGSILFTVGMYIKNKKIANYTLLIVSIYNAIIFGFHESQNLVISILGIILAIISYIKIKKFKIEEARQAEEERKWQIQFEKNCEEEKRQEYIRNQAELERQNKRKRYISENRDRIIDEWGELVNLRDSYDQNDGTYLWSKYEHERKKLEKEYPEIF